ncbi:hypothetical protein C2S51_014094 [Perilla frutescens var. frutescens]|nr:hypothetical protein C2S51_014094 [Perilla frutescens var. frutescens]
MMGKNTLLITLAWLLLVAYFVTCSYAANTKPADRVVHPEGCRCCLFNFSKPLITCVKVCCGQNCC